MDFDIVPGDITATNHVRVKKLGKPQFQSLARRCARLFANNLSKTPLVEGDDPLLNFVPNDIPAQPQHHLKACKIEHVGRERGSLTGLALPDEALTLGEGGPQTAGSNRPVLNDKRSIACVSTFARMLLVMTFVTQGYAQHLVFLMKPQNMVISAYLIPVDLPVRSKHMVERDNVVTVKVQASITAKTTDTPITPDPVVINFRRTQSALNVFYIRESLHPLIILPSTGFTWQKGGFYPAIVKNTGFCKVHGVNVVQI